MAMANKHWSESPWVSWGLVLLMMTAMFVFGAWGCGKPVHADEISDLTNAVNQAFSAGVHVGKLCDNQTFNHIAVCCDESKAKLTECDKATKDINWPRD